MAGFFVFLGQTMADQPNYHINLWPEPPGPPTYLCLLCALKDCTQATMQAHVTTTHAVTPVPTPLAADASLVPSLLRTEEAPDAGRSADVSHRDE